MGMDVYGNEPDDPAGEYFRASIFGWPTILDAIIGANVLPDELCAAMSYNDGMGPDAEQAVRLADAMEANLDAGVTPDESEAGDRALGVGNAVISAFGGDPVGRSHSDDERSIRHFITFARHSGGFKVW